MDKGFYPEAMNPLECAKLSVGVCVWKKEREVLFVDVIFILPGARCIVFIDSQRGLWLRIPAQR